MPDTVLVTGASGFIAGHCVAELAGHGYAVRGTVRRPGSAAHLGGLAGPVTAGPVTADLVTADLVTADLVTADLVTADLVTADLESDDGWAEAVAGCTYVLHVASPLPMSSPADDGELIRPAVEGALRVLRASAASGTVRRVVLTSSMAAVRPARPASDRTLTEDDWCDPAACDDAYQKSKTLAERAAWEFAEREAGDMELAVINPGLALGPVQHAATGTSLEPVRRLLAREVPGVPRLGWATVDVRDLAIAHRLAMETPRAAGNRYICCGPHVWMSEMAEILATRYRVPTRPIPNWLVWLIARFDPAVRGVLDDLGVRELASADKARRDLGWTMRPLAETLLDTAASLIEAGIIPAPSRP